MCIPSLPRSVRALHKNGPLPNFLSQQSVRHESTARRLTKRLNIAPAPSYIKTTGFTGDHIIFNPPSSAPSVHHTPLKFLPKNDKRRELYAAAAAKSRTVPAGNGIAQSGTPLSQSESDRFVLSASSTFVPLPPSATSSYANSSSLPPPVRTPYEKKYHLTEDDIEAIRSLRISDPKKWTRIRLAEKFGCSPLFVAMVCQSPQMATEQKAADEKAREKWGRRKREAREDRQRRRETWGRDD